MKKLGKLSAVILGIVFLVCGASYAQEDIDALKSQVNDLNYRLKQLEKDGCSSCSSDGEVSLGEGICRCSGITFVLQGTRNANADASYKGDDALDASFSLDLGIEKELGDGSRAVLAIETGEGAGVTDELKVFSNVNADVDNSAGVVSLTQAFVEKNLLEDMVVLTVGKIDPTCYIDTNAYANDECAQFLGDTFRNSPVVEFPANTIGVRTGIVATEMVDLEVALLDGNADYENIFDDAFFTLQVNLKPQLLERDGNYRLVYWRNNSNHIKWSDATKIKEEANGWGISFDQEVMDNVGVFLRAGGQSDDITSDVTAASLGRAYSLGCELGGAFWGRDGDVLGIAFGLVEPSDEYKKYYNVINLGTTDELKAKTEGHFEAYYNFVVNDNLTVSPDIQLITNPYGKDAASGTSTIMVAGVRCQVNF